MLEHHPTPVNDIVANGVCLLCVASRRANAVFVSALYLIHQTNQIMITVKNKCE